MKITNLASGSKGNSTLIETKTKNILIDAGLPLSNLEKRLEAQMPKIDILIITHIHIDHIKGINSIIKKHNPVIYSKDQELQTKIPEKEINYDKNIKENNLEIELFPLSHDVPCIGVYIKEEEKEFVYITDTGYVKEKILTKYQNKDAYILESNYEEEMLQNGKYPFHLKQRIRSDKGHISNIDSCRYITKLTGPKTKKICLAHLSEENNTEEIVKQRVTETLETINHNIEKIIILSQTEKQEIEI